MRTRANRFDLRSFFVSAAVRPRFSAAAMRPSHPVAADPTEGGIYAASQWMKPPQDILDILHASEPPWHWPSPTGVTLLLVDPTGYPPLAELAAPMHRLAGTRVDPATHGYYGVHGGAHTDLFAAGVARSGSYNKTMQPFGVQNERRSLFEAHDVYVNVSPTFSANKVNEPILIIHGQTDSNPGTLTFQSE